MPNGDVHRICNVKYLNDLIKSLDAGLIRKIRTSSIELKQVSTKIGRPDCGVWFDRVVYRELAAAIRRAAGVFAVFGARLGFVV